MERRPSGQSDQEISAECYALSVTALGGSICIETAGTEWLNQSPEGNEIREAAPYYDVQPWDLFKECWVRVASLSELLNFLCSGGHSLVRREVLSAWWPEFFAQTECFRYNEDVPFIGTDYLPPGAEERYPPALIRKRVFARDGHRCRICGHSPEDHQAIKLEIHHVLENALGGLTLENNLLTLCKNCHDNAVPPDAWLRDDLFKKIVVAASRYHRRSHEQGVADYRTWVTRALGPKWAASSIEHPLEYLTVDDLDDTKRYANWHFAYRMLAANSLVRYFDASEWRRILPAELKRK